MNKQTKDEVLKILSKEYAGAGTELIYKSPYELLVATVLAAQCTDARVNIITKPLFAKYDTPGKMITLSIDELEEYIKSCGLYRAKAKNILALSQIIVEKYNGEVPRDIELLRTLPGVGRKTANVVAAVAFGIPAIAVDTHVFRVSNRIGLTEANDVLKTEMQLMDLIEKEKWGSAHHWILIHGRRVCSAKNPKCTNCPINNICDKNGVI